MNNLDFKKISIFLSGLIIILFISFQMMNFRFSGVEIDNEDVYKIAAKKGHSIKIDKLIQSEDVRVKFDRILYGKRTVIIDLSYEKENNNKEFWIMGGILYIERDNDKIEVIGGGKNTGEDDETGFKKSELYFNLANEQLRVGDKVSLKISNNNFDKEQGKIDFEKVELPMKKKILRKEDKVYSINEEISVDDIKIKLGEFIVAPITAYLEVASDYADEEQTFGGMGDIYITDRRNNKYRSFGAIGISEDNRYQKRKFISSYYKTDDNLKINIKGIWIQNRKEYTAEITDNNKLKTDCKYKINLDFVDRYEDGRIKGFTLKVEDKRLEESINRDPRFGVYDMWVGDIKLELFKDYQIYNTTELNGDRREGIKINTPREGKLRFKLSDFMEYKKVNEEFNVFRN